MNGIITPISRVGITPGKPIYFRPVISGQAPCHSYDSYVFPDRQKGPAHLARNIINVTESLPSKQILANFIVMGNPYQNVGLSMTMWIYRNVNPAEKIMRSCLKTTPYLPSMYISTKNLHLKKRYQHFISFLLLFFSGRFHSFIPRPTLPPAFGCFRKWWYPQSTSKWSFLVGKPMVVG